MVSSSNLSYHCSVCDKRFGSRKQWLRHLLRSPHQNRGRKEVISWNSKVKSCVLVAYASFPIAREQVLRSFGDLGRDTIVTDFVWSERRPKVGLIQFESRAKVSEVMEMLGGPEMRIEDEDGHEQFIQLKKAAECLEFEWDGLMEAFQEDGVEMESGDHDNCDDAPMETEDLIENDDDDGQNNEENEDVKPDISGLAKATEQPPNFILDTTGIVVKTERIEPEATSTSSATIQCQTRPVSANPLPNPAPETESEDVKPCRYRQQYEAILNEISIPDEEYNQALEVMEKCRQIFATKFPASKLFLLRHWHLKLKNTGMNELLFYVDFDGTLDGSHLQEEFYEKPFKLSLPDLESLFASPHAQAVLPGVNSVPKSEQNANFEPKAHQFQHEPSGLKFSIVADSLFKTEAQTCRLVNFLLDCDPRARPIFTLIFYWAKRTRTKISWPSCKFRHKSHSFAPEPAGLEWMILLFLVHKKVIPSPREVLHRSHQKLVVFKKADIGFSTQKWHSFSSPKLPHENSHEFFLGLIQLAQEFFSFYAELRSDKWILNTRDGEMIKKDDFLHKNPYVDWKTKLKPEEIAVIKQAGKDYQKTLLNLDNQDVMILHPLFVEWPILFSLNTFVSSTDYRMMVAAATIKKNFEDGIRSKQHTLKSMFARVPVRELQRISDELPYLPEHVQRNLDKRLEKNAKLRAKNGGQLPKTRQQRRKAKEKLQRKNNEVLKLIK